MSTPCEELEPKILDRVAGAASPEDAALVDAHLSGCPECRTWLASCEEAVSLVALPPLSPREEQWLEELPERARLAFRSRPRRRRARWVAGGVALAAAASLAAAVLAPGAPELGGRGAAEGEAALPAADLSAWALADPLEEELSASLDDGDGEALDGEDDAVTEE